MAAHADPAEADQRQRALDRAGVDRRAAGLRALAADWQIENTGAFMKWNGEPHPW